MQGSHPGGGPRRDQYGVMEGGQEKGVEPSKGASQARALRGRFSWSRWETP